MRGFVTIELLIALMLAVFTISGVLFTFSGSQSFVSDSEISGEALRKAEDVLEQAVGLSRGSYGSITSTTSSECTEGFCFTKQISVATSSVVECGEAVAATLSWTGSGGRALFEAATTTLVDFTNLFALGGDCAAAAPVRQWVAPARFASDAVPFGKSTTLDELGGIVYVGLDTKPYLAVADTRGATQNQTSGFFVSFANNFNSDGKTIDQINDIDVYRSGTKTYALLALASSTAQFGILDVSDFKNPVLLAKRSLAGVDPHGSQPNGYRVYYNDGKAYITTKETSGPEFHIFDVSNPSAPIELGSAKLTGPTPPNGTTVNDFVVKNGIAYFATDKSAGELMVYDVRNASSPQYLPGATVDLPGTQNAQAIFMAGKTLYVGRASVSTGPELYAFDASSPLTASGGLPLLGTGETGTSINGIRVAGPFAYLSVSKVGQEFQIFNVADATHIVVWKKYSSGTIVPSGFDYAPEQVFVTGNATPSFQILYTQS